MIVRSTQKFAVFDLIKENENIDNDKDDDNEQFFNDLITAQDINYDNARDVSREERDQMVDGISKYGSLTYGEIPYSSMKEIFDVIKSELSNTTNQSHYFNLYDLGSGSGASTLAAVLQLTFKNAVGIEILAGLYNMSLKIKKSWEISSVGKFNCKVDFIHGSILDNWDWLEQSQPCIVFANSTCFNDEMFSTISENSKLLHTGSYLITLSIPIVVPKGSIKRIKILKELRLEMSWGQADVFIQKII